MSDQGKDLSHAEADANSAVGFSYGELVAYIEQEREALRGPVRLPTDIDKHDYNRLAEIGDVRKAVNILESLVTAGKLVKVIVYDERQNRKVAVYRYP